MVKPDESVEHTTGGTGMCRSEAEAYAKALQPFYRSATVKVFDQANGFAWIYVDWEWSSGLSNFVVNTREEAEAVLRSLRAS